jgi:hypothetical protein
LPSARRLPIAIALPHAETSLQRTLAALDAHIAANSAPSGDRSIPSGRLAHLMQQACAQQLCGHPLGKIRSIMSDFVPALLPRVTDAALRAV